MTFDAIDKSMFEVVFANLDRVEDAYRMFRWALTGIGGGMVLIGLVMFLYRPKEEERQSKFSARITALVSFGLIGLATIVYAWTLFGS